MCLRLGRRWGDRQNCKLVAGIRLFIIVAVHLGQATFKSVERLRSTPSRAGGGPKRGLTLEKCRRLRRCGPCGPLFSRLYCESVQKFEVMFRFQMYPPNKRFEPLCSSVNTNCTEQWTHRVTDRDNLVFGSDRTPNTSSEPLFSCTDTNCTGQTDRQTDRQTKCQTSPSCFTFFKGATAKTA